MRLFTPFARVNTSTLIGVSIVTYVAMVSIWIALPNTLLPSPLEVWQKFGYIVTERGLFHETWTSFVLNLEATLIAGTLAMILAYCWVIPALRPFVEMCENWRFMGLTGISFFFMLMFSSAHSAKVAAVVFVMLPFILTSLCDSVRSIEESAVNHARTLKLSPFRTVWEIGIWGSRDKTIEAIRQNFAIGWGTTAAVEGFIRSEGGVGLMIVEQAKYLRLAELFGTLLFVLVLGLLQNKILIWIRNVSCPYANIGRGAR
jgi:ABC-type nitrate/sulfonate/bicarbonate transport system permease component